MIHNGKHRGFRLTAAVPVVIALALGACLSNGSQAIVQQVQRMADTARAARQGSPAGAAADGRTLYVDVQLAADSCTTYSATTRRCDGGTEAAYRDPDAASRAATPGDTVMIRGGVYARPFAPATSGRETAAITFRGHPGETVTFTQTAATDGPAITIRGRSYLTIQSIAVEDVHAWIGIEDSHHIVIRDSRFSRAGARGSKAGLKFVGSHDNKILNNVLEDGNDNVTLLESDRNVVEGNDFRLARHSLVAVWCANFNVIRRNRFVNTRQKAIEVHDCDGQYGLPLLVDATKRNLFEGNAFLHTRASVEFFRYNGIQYAGQMGIVRKNVFVDNQGGALNHHVYPTEAFYNYGHRIYQNTFYANRCYALRSSTGTGHRFPDTIMKANLLYRNVDCAGDPVQAAMPAPSEFQRAGNVTVKATDDPGFVDAAKMDLRLRADSPLIGKGGFLTQAVRAGSGTIMAVDDAWYFYDGYGIAGEAGDQIQLAGTRQRARVVSVDYVQSTLTLDRALTWAAGQGVALAYEGDAPDPGAYDTAAAPGDRAADGARSH